VSPRAGLSTAGATGVGDDATAVGGVVVRLLLAALFRERLFFAMSMCS